MVKIYNIIIYNNKPNKRNIFGTNISIYRNI